jgi:hypothetical protein
MFSTASCTLRCDICVDDLRLECMRFKILYCNAHFFENLKGWCVYFLFPASVFVSMLLSMQLKLAILRIVGHTLKCDVSLASQCLKSERQNKTSAFYSENNAVCASLLAEVKIDCWFISTSSRCCCAFY